MIEVNIGMKRERMKRLATDLLAAVDDGSNTVEVRLYAKNNNRTDEEVIVTINNDDMEHPTNSPDSMYVEINEED